MQLEDLDKRIEDHAIDDLRFQEATTRVQKEILDRIDIIKENHLAHIEPDVAVIKFQVQILLAGAAAILGVLVRLAFK